MTILRIAPGDRVPSTGTYALVGHFGEATGFVKWFGEGDQFPRLAPVAIDTDIAPLWYVKVYEWAQVARAA